MMHRRILPLVFGAALLLSNGVAASAPDASKKAVVLYDDRSVVLDQVGTNPAHSPDGLWVRKTDLPRINEFELKPQGACRGEVCIPVDKTMTRGRFFNLTAFAHKIGQPLVFNREAHVWSFGEIPLLRGQFLESRASPDFAVPDRTGRSVHLSDFRGKKVLVLTWASW